MSMSNLLPSAYEWLIPRAVGIGTIDEMAVSGTFPKVYDLLPSVVFAIIFGIIRSILQSVLFKPVAIVAMKLKFSNQKPNPEIDRLLVGYKNKAEKLTDETCKKLSDKTGQNKTQIKRYIWNKNRDEVNQRKVIKFGEAMWRAMFYLSFTILGYITLCMPEYAIWLSNTRDHWNNWPNHPISYMMNLYYQIELGCYLHQLHWTEVTRSDAIEMILHHCITIILIVSSYLTNFTRIGTSILLTHDFADVFLEIGKCFNYTSKTPEFKSWASKITDSLFACFTLSFFYTRLVLFPRYLVYSLVYEAPDIMGMWSGYYLFASMLIGLQCLHIFWFYLIARMIYRLTIVGEIEKDVRSDDEDGEDSSEEDSLPVIEGDKKEN